MAINKCEKNEKNTHHSSTEIENYLQQINDMAPIIYMYHLCWFYFARATSMHFQEYRNK